MLNTKISQLLSEPEDKIDWRTLTKYGQAFVRSTQHAQPHGEAVALLDLHPYGDCNESYLVENYLSSIPFRKKRKKRRECPIAANVLFRNNGPHVTGEANMRAIAAYEKDKADKAADKAARKLQRTQKIAKKRQDATMEVVNMVVQQLLQSQTPPLQFFDESGEMVSRTFKPDAQACKKFMQVRATNDPLLIHDLFTHSLVCVDLLCTCSPWLSIPRTCWRQENLWNITCAPWAMVKV